MQQKAIVIIPTYNERENIQKVIPLLFEQFEKVKGWDMGVLVVDDTSPDKTYEVVQKMQKKQKKLHLLINPEKAGLGGASGRFESLKEVALEYAFIMDLEGIKS